MRQDILDYAKRMEQWADGLIEASKKAPMIEVSDLKSMDDIDSARATIVDCLKEYEKQKLLLQTIAYPVEISAEQKQIFQAIEQLINGLKMAEQSVTIINRDIDNGKDVALVSFEEYIQGNAQADMAVKMVSTTVKVLGDKLESLLK